MSLLTEPKALEASAIELSKKRVRKTALRSPCLKISCKSRRSGFASGIAPEVEVVKLPATAPTRWIFYSTSFSMES